MTTLLVIILSIVPTFGQMLVNPYVVATESGGGGSGDLLTGLVSHWKLNEASGTRVDSHSGYDLTDSTSVGSATGVIGDAADFLASNNVYLEVASNTDFDLSGHTAFTWAAWIRPGSGNGTQSGIIVKGRNTASATQFRIRFLNGNYSFMVSDGATTGIVEGPAYAVGTWAFVVCWHDPDTDTVNIQVDDGTINSTAHSTGVNTGATAVSEVISFGRTPNQASAYDGQIDSVSFWRRLLTESEKTLLYNSGAGLDYESF